MKKTIDKKVYDAYTAILNRELVAVSGCTEPAALAYAASSAAELLGQKPVSARVVVSGNLIKNTKSVIVPNTGGMFGIEAAVAAGAVAGRSGLGLQSISEVDSEEIKRVKEFLRDTKITIEQSDSDLIFDIKISLKGESASSCVRICNEHSNIIYKEKNGEVLLNKPVPLIESAPEKEAQNLLLNIRDIVGYANLVDLADIKEPIEKQIELNSAIANEGLKGRYGANIGKILLRASNNIEVRAKAKAAAASDARMNGCPMPVVIISGSGNQGITASLPVIEYANELNVGYERLLRALVLSNLLTLHQKRFIGRLSAYCGVVCAGAASGGAIAFLYGGDYEEIANTTVNALAVASGMVCDGAKSSCAAKIAIAVEAGIMGYMMYKNGSRFLCGEGIVDHAEQTIRNVGILGSVGMRETDRTILSIMLQSRSAECINCENDCTNCPKKKLDR